jgi:pSer/pThr/pTyr-binding forkhead associated (FHA) protein
VATAVRLTVLNGPHKGNRFCCRQCKAMIVGRAGDCDISLNDAHADLRVSRRHCRLQFESDCILVHDLASKNGTFINGILVGQEDQARDVLTSDDLLTVGETTLGIEFFDCPLSNSAEGESGWPEDVTILKNCPLNC